MSKTEIFDVFLSYNAANRNIVEAIALRLKERNVRVFLDRWYLIGGAPWPQVLEQTLNSCHSAAVFLGAAGMGSWQQREQQLALDLQVKKKSFRVIPVILPGGDPPLGFLSLNTWIDLRNGYLDEHSIELLISAIRGLPPGADLLQRTHDALANICPYRGLRYFREEDAPFFFGRETFIAKLEKLIQQHTFVAVIGASGSGKSSVVRAGLLPLLRSSGTTRWDITTIVPGDQPFKNLSAALLSLLQPDMTEVDRLHEISKLAEALQVKTIRLKDVVSRILELQSGTDKLMLVIDQWEEIYAPGVEENLRNRFFDELLDSLAPGILNIVITLRGDFYDQALSYRPLSDRLQDSVVNISRMNREELKEAIALPAQKTGLVFEPGLINRILDKLKDQPGNLPLLEFALTELWKGRQGNRLTHDAYEKIGEIEGAIASHAETAFNSLTPTEQLTGRRIFLQLVHPGFLVSDARVEPTRRRASFEEFEPAAIAVIRKLANEHLVVTSRNEVNGEEIVDLVHEALIRNWQRLHDWIEEDQAFLGWREQLRSMLGIAKAKNFSGSTLLHGTLLAEAKEWQKKRPEDLSKTETNFITLSIRTRAKKIKSQVLSVLAVLLFSALILLARGIFFTNRSNHSNDSKVPSTELTQKNNDSTESETSESPVDLLQTQAAKPISFMHSIVDRIHRTPDFHYSRMDSVPTPVAHSSDDKRRIAIILHDAFAPDQAINVLKNGRNDLPGPLTHWVVQSDGDIYIVADETRKANHAGRADRGLSNSNTIGIEVTGNPALQNEKQIESLVRLVADVADRWNIPTNMILSHAEVALPRGRKPDMLQQAPFVRQMVDSVRKLR